MSWARLAATLFFSLVAISVRSQETRETLEGTWQGSLTQGRNTLRPAFTFSRDNGRYSATLTSDGLGVYGMPTTSLSVTGDRITFRIPRLDLEFSGFMHRDEDGKIQCIEGNWFQYSELVPLVLLPTASL